MDLMRMSVEQRKSLYERMASARIKYELTWPKVGERFGLSRNQTLTLIGTFQYTKASRKE